MQPYPSHLVKRVSLDDRHMALIAVARHNGTDSESAVAVARYIITDAGASCEFAIVVADARQHRGVGTRLMRIEAER